MQGRALLLALTVVAAACSPGPQSRPSPATPEQGTRVPSPTVTPPTTPTPAPTPVTHSFSGRAIVATSGSPVAGVRIRGQSSYPEGQPPPPDATAVTDDRGAYTLSFPTWTQEALGGNTPTLTLNVELPPGFVLVGVTKSVGAPPGSGPGVAMLMLDDLVGPIDIALGPGHVVEGRVTSGLTGAPLEGIRMMALRPNSMLIHGGVGDAFEIEATDSTDAAGRYSLTVPSGTYVIDAVEPQGDQQRYWSDDPAVFQATPVKIERAVAGIDIALVPVTAIGGQVRSGPSFAEGVAGTRVAAYLAGGTPCCRSVGVATTGPVGTFVMYVPRGLYRIVFDPPAGSPYAAQWWSGAAGFATATDVTVGPEPVQLEVELARVIP